MIYEIKNDLLTAKINSLGAELTSVKSRDGYEYIWQGEDWRGHAPVLFPLCGRINGGKYTYRGREYEMRLHGFAPTSEFKLVSKTESSLTLLLEADEVTLAQYPFDFRLTLSFTLAGRALEAVFKVENLSGEVLPYMIGWHPGFNLDPAVENESYYLDFGAECDVRLHPVIDRAFIAKSTVPFKTDDGRYYVNDVELDDFDTLVLENTASRVTLASSASPRGVALSWSDGIPNFCVWRAPFKKTRFLCLEPWSNLPGDGTGNEDFDTRDMTRIGAGEAREYFFNTEFFGF
ncbi:MAG: aldose 1-epimerase family protein [Clostridia bacterium]|nr:aldose 1-epimerase family protein [Clostridia bacterium]